MSQEQEAVDQANGGEAIPPQDVPIDPEMQAEVQQSEQPVDQALVQAAEGNMEQLDAVPDPAANDQIHE